jgi:hypothetical protein
MNYISLSNDDIIIYNKIQTKIYKTFIKHHKTYGNSFDIQECDDIKLYNNSQNYCKYFKYNVCLCYRNFKDITKIKLIYNDFYKCINNKNILYNPNNFNFINPLLISLNNEKIYPIDITSYYRQEYLPYIIHNEFMKYKNTLKIINTITKNRLHRYFLLLKSNTNNTYYNELIDIFVPNTHNNYLLLDNITETKNNASTQTNNNYYLLFTLLLNDYNKIIKDYNNLILDLI